ncbi:hypothetical protein K438DRAFT_1980295 [Mycena galopus ATCC 62051]|nr:hypothetical protein K438DRAFT_1980295 [Mycena galopus ATCC 62051]
MPQNLASFTGNSAPHFTPRDVMRDLPVRRKIAGPFNFYPVSLPMHLLGRNAMDYTLVVRNGAQQSQAPMTNKLETPIAVLETSSCDDDYSMFFQEPPDSEGIPQTWTMSASVGISASRDETQPSASHMSGPVIEGRYIFMRTLSYVRNPPSDVIERLVGAFFNNFSHVGFFLDVAASRHSAFLAVPFASCGRPLIPFDSIYNEDAILVYTLQNMNHMNGDHPKRMLHSIQAHALVSLYYFTLGKPVEGIYHSNAAVSLALSAGLLLCCLAISYKEVVAGAVTQPPVPQPPFRGTKRLGNILGFTGRNQDRSKQESTDAIAADSDHDEEDHVKNETVNATDVNRVHHDEKPKLDRHSAPTQTPLIKVKHDPEADICLDGRTDDAKAEGGQLEFQVRGDQYLDDKSGRRPSPEAPSHHSGEVNVGPAPFVKTEQLELIVET